MQKFLPSTMNKEVKDILMRTVTQSTVRHVHVIFIKYKLIQDESFFDYELLKLALERKHFDITNFLLKLGCRVRNPNKCRMEETTLHLAMKLSSSGDLCDHIIRTLLKNGASITDTNHNGETALYAGFKAGYNSNVKVALSFISSVNGNGKQLQTNIDSSLKCLNPDDEDNIVNFHIACAINHYPAIDLYLRRGFDVNLPLTLDSAKFFGLNPLHYAASIGDQYIFKNFVKHGGDLSIKNSNGLTPLHIIYYNKHTNLMEIAFKNGNDTKFINCVDNNGVSHFYLCCSVNYPDMVKVFIRKGINVNISVSSSCSVFPGFTPLHMAIKYSCSEVVQLLLENAADCNKVDKKGCTPLHLACETYFRWDIVKLLLYYGADINIEDSLGNWTVLTMFHEWNGISIQQLWEDAPWIAKQFKIIFIHIQKLLALGSYVSKKIQNYYLKLSECFQNALSRVDEDINLDNIFDNCVEELNRMKLIKIDRCNSLYNVLQKNSKELPRLIKKKTFVEIMENKNIDNDFPLYSFLLKLKFKEGLKRSDLLKQAKFSLVYMIKSNLPDICCDVVLKYLSNEDIINLNESAKSSYKRKLNSDSNSDNEPPAKLQKSSCNIQK